MKDIPRHDASTRPRRDKRVGLYQCLTIQAVCVKRNIEARSHNHCCREKAIKR